MACFLQDKYKVSKTNKQHALAYNGTTGRLVQAETALAKHTAGLPDHPVQVPLTTLYAWRESTRQFVKVGYSCMLCHATWRTEAITKKHPYRCTKLKKPKDPEET